MGRPAQLRRAPARSGIGSPARRGGGSGRLTWTAAAGVSTAARIEVAYANSSPTTAYASANNNSGEVYQSTDGGATFTLRSTPGHLGGQGWYANCIWVDPTNPNVLVVGGLDLWRSVDGGATFSQISQWYSAPNSAHADHHCIVQSSAFKGVNNTTVFFGNDARVYRAANVYAVPLGDEGALLTSPDGIRWTVGNPGTDDRLRGIAFGNGRFVAAGYNGTILTSKAGLSWTLQFSGVAERLQSVAFGHGRFVVVGWGGQILTSSRGLNWAKRNSGTTCNLSSVSFENETFVVTDASQNRMISLNGTAWTNRSAAIAQR